MKTKIKSKKIDECILDLLEREKGAFSIRLLTLQLEEYYNIRCSPQIVKRHLESLKGRK